MTLPRPVRKLAGSPGLWSLVFSFVFQCLVYSGSRLITAGWGHTDMTTAFDAATPFWPWTVAVYVAAYFFWAVNYNLAALNGGSGAWRFLAADALGKTVCLAVFMVLPTANVRSPIPDGAALGWLMGLIRLLDTPDNLFPSVHCFNSWLCWAGIRDRRDIPAFWRHFSLVFTLAIGVSTLTTKQHVIADVAAGFVLAELCWQAAGHTGLGAWYGRLWGRKKNVPL